VGLGVGAGVGWAVGVGPVILTVMEHTSDSLTLGESQSIEMRV
jgi:hypothetical protein